MDNKLIKMDNKLITLERQLVSMQKMFNAQTSFNEIFKKIMMSIHREITDAITLNTLSHFDIDYVKSNKPDEIMIIATTKLDKIELDFFVDFFNKHKLSIQNNAPRLFVDGKIYMDIIEDDSNILLKYINNDPVRKKITTIECTIIMTK